VNRQEQTKTELTKAYTLLQIVEGYRLFSYLQTVKEVLYL